MKSVLQENLNCRDSHFARNSITEPQITFFYQEGYIAPDMTM